MELGLSKGWFAPTMARVLLTPVLALFLLSCVLALPPLVGMLLKLFAFLLKQPLGMEGTLALHTLLGKRTRTSLTAGVLCLAVAVAIAFGHSLLNTLGDLRTWYGRTIVADFLVRGSMPDSSFVLAAGLPEQLAEEIAGLEGILAVDKIAFVPMQCQMAGAGEPCSTAFGCARPGGQQVLVLARTFTLGQPLPLDIREGQAAAVREGLLRGEVVVATSLAQQLNRGLGDSVMLETLRGPVSLRIAGTANEYAVGGQALYLEWNAARRLLDLNGVHVFLITARPGATAALADALRSFCGRHQLLLQSYAEVRDFIDRLLARVAGMLWVLLALTFVVASLGVVNTLTMNVLEQTHDLAVLRALGMKRCQVRRVVLAQAFLTSLTSLVPGSAAGVLLAYLLNRSSNYLHGHQVAFRVDWVLVCGCCIMALVIGVVAALIPAQRAGKVSGAALQHGI